MNAYFILTYSDRHDNIMDISRVPSAFQNFSYWILQSA